mmetsp:Transcript_37642/g.111310  ORF Transcript_37642/g.111310 Transcript_37642/m.111310 type:complete len:234 (-) Transcript_37642:1451-2152(-)
MPTAKEAAAKGTQGAARLCHASAACLPAAARVHCKYTAGCCQVHARCTPRRMPECMSRRMPECMSRCMPECMRDVGPSAPLQALWLPSWQACAVAVASASTKDAWFSWLRTAAAIVPARKLRVLLRCQLHARRVRLGSGCVLWPGVLHVGHAWVHGRVRPAVLGRVVGHAVAGAGGVWIRPLLPATGTVGVHTVRRLSKVRRAGPQGSRRHCAVVGRAHHGLAGAAAVRTAAA